MIFHAAVHTKSAPCLVCLFLLKATSHMAPAIFSLYLSLDVFFSKRETAASISAMRALILGRARRSSHSLHVVPSLNLPISSSVVSTMLPLGVIVLTDKGCSWSRSCIFALVTLRTKLHKFCTARTDDGVGKMI